MTRRSFAASSAAAPAVLSAASQVSSQMRKGNLHQSVCRWCYSKVPLEDLAKEAAKMGLVGIDLLTPEEWPVVQKYGLMPTMASGVSTIPKGINRVEHHDEIEQQLRTMFRKAKAAKVPNIIIFSGNRQGLADEPAIDNCVKVLNQVKAEAEDLGITVQMELLNSKVNHKDYQCDHTRWGVEVVKRVGSPRVKLLYDIYHMQIMEGDVIRTIQRQHSMVRAYPHRRRSRTQRDRYVAGAAMPAIARPSSEPVYGLLRARIHPQTDPLESLAEATTLCDL